MEVTQGCGIWKDIEFLHLSSSEWDPSVSWPVASYTHNINVGRSNTAVPAFRAPFKSATVWRISRICPFPNKCSPLLSDTGLFLEVHVSNWWVCEAHVGLTVDKSLQTPLVGGAEMVDRSQVTCRIRWLQDTVVTHTGYTLWGIWWREWRGYRKWRWTDRQRKEEGKRGWSGEGSSCGKEILYNILHIFVLTIGALTSSYCTTVPKGYVCIHALALTESLSMNLIMSGMFLVMKGLRLVMKGSLVLNSTRLARFWTALATSLREREEDSEGLPGGGEGRVG